jgi:hydrogenase small subunit
MTPFYKHLEGVPGFGVASSIDKVGLWATVGVGAAFAAHGVLSLAQRMSRAEHHPAARERSEEAKRREDEKKGGQP